MRNSKKNQLGGKKMNQNSNNMPITSINDYLKERENFGKELWSELRYFRDLPIKKKSKRAQDLNRPVAVYTKPDRLMHGIGTELNIIFKSKACSWARSKSGGCTMCGYWNDRAPDNLTEDNLWNQFEYALKDKSEILADPSENIIFKMFSSGSFCDPNEFSKELQLKILSKLCEYESIKEIVIESRPEYLKDDLLGSYQSILSPCSTNHNNSDKPLPYLEIGIGLETSNDFIRKNFINKGFTWESFQHAVQKVHSFGLGVKAYLLFKPPFIDEYAAMSDMVNSIRDCITIGVDTISINPANIQNNTICAILEHQYKFRPPWFYSLLHLLKTTLTPEDLQKTRIISDPSASGKSRGIHNCTQGDESNFTCKKILEEFVLHQNTNVIPSQFSDDLCWNEFIYEVLF